ncbi:MAG: cysteine desulfurase-like protein [Actinobacteria bacterium]|nr:cysteine desulfurase-like protein [Actinomycetota bacterium]MSV78515.1 cysteine desulfurase-like protein [Actinomycetota bacterium]MSW15985.1 cysteine desulfurase-like protein [Actinomycetota bacterium]MSX44672.1 cysteine desulfurase-like protein [Actinomycetota bacterium]MSX85233.1 cysteine desulfurase-like protein [Actinomycetota bacterium]
MTYDVNRIRAQFPALNSGTAFFDGPGGSQVPKSVGDAISQTITASVSNRGTTTKAEQNADAAVLGFRSAVADLLDCNPEGVVYGRSWTQITYDFSRTLAKTWKPGDEIIVTRLDHDSNVRPWVQAAEAVGATVKWAQIDINTGELAPEVIGNLLSAKTKLVAVTGASNVIGTRPDIAAISKLVHAVGALFYVDGVHLTPHTPISMKELGADFYGFSSYKLFGPHCAAIAAAPELLRTLNNDKLLPATSEVPERFEFGTLPYEIMAGVTAAIDFIADVIPNQSGTRRAKIVASMIAMERYEEELFRYMDGKLRGLPKIKLYSNASHRTPTAFFTFDGLNSSDVYKHLASKNVNAPASNFYGLEACLSLGLGDAGAIRAGLAPYSTREDVDRLISGISELL